MLPLADLRCLLDTDSRAELFQGQSTRRLKVLMEVHEANSVATASENQVLFATVLSATVGPMDTIPAKYQHRIAALRELIRMRFGNNKAALGRALGFRDGSLIGQMERGERPITEKMIEKIESLPSCGGWFSSNLHSAAPEEAVATPAPPLPAWPFRPELHARLMRLSAAERFHIEMAVLEAIERCEDYRR